jgi:hypothetical protein
MEEDRPLDISIKHQDSDTGENFKSSHYILVSINSNETPVVRTNIDDRAIILFRIVEVLSTLLGVGSTSPQTTARLDVASAPQRTPNPKGLRMRKLSLRTWLAYELWNS